MPVTGAKMTFDKDDPLSDTVVSSNTSTTIVSETMVPSLEELVDACCLDHIHGNHDTEQFFKDPLTPQNFKNFIVKRHCEENLQFLIQIYTYEFIWNKLFKRRSSILKCKISSNKRRNFANVDGVSKKTSPMHSKNGTTTSIETISNRTNGSTKDDFDLLLKKIDLNTEELSSFVNLKLSNSHDDTIISSTSSTQMPQIENWNRFEDFRLSSHSHGDGQGSVSSMNHHHDDDLLDSCACNNEFKEDADPQIRRDLTNQWHNIIHEYIDINAPYQINLPGYISREISKESSNNDILYHSPEILIGAKNFVLQLLRENIYEEFVSQYTSTAVLAAKVPTNSSICSSVSSCCSSTLTNGKKEAKEQFEKYSQRSQNPPSHTAAGIVPITRGHTVHSFEGFPQGEQATRGPCNVRVSEDAIVHPHPDTKHHHNQGQNNGHHHHFHLHQFHHRLPGYHHNQQHNYNGESQTEANDLARRRSHGDESSGSSLNSQQKLQATTGGQELNKKRWVKKLLKH